ncbi:5'-nucleotidase C-terminal domain-containing protein [Gaetbulibacter saemankumensis]|uniref:5'-nucleotidase C-terminal domain-containing protein n=1 Tax=Gaetbulibacter saemankumensis TaxID=311208 RepID=UPI000419FFCA|nr:5'-nucleotidase [Gaetbulibacter saemankumensis]
MTFKYYFLIIAAVFSISSCKDSQPHLTQIKGYRIAITDSLKTDFEIDDFITPFREHINDDLNEVLAYAPETYSKDDGQLNSSLGNFMADAVYNRANPIFKSRTGNNIDMVILNHGSIRGVISKGDITKRTAYNVMPFENSLVVVALKKQQLDKLVTYLAKLKKAHPISKLKILIDDNYEVVKVTINNNKILADKIYYVCTNDFLYNGGDDMTFFQPNNGLYVLNYKVRNALIDTFTDQDTINSMVDDRFIQIK